MTKFFSSLRYCLIIFISFLSLANADAQLVESDSAADMEALLKLIDSMNKLDKAIHYQKGKVAVNDFLTLNVPSGYKFIPDSSAKMIVTKLWNNPEDESILGMVVPTDFSLSNFSSWAFVVSYEESGYVKDEDAEEIDYDKMMNDIQSSETETNAERTKLGYDAIHILGWAAKPFYDKDRKILHWAKKIQFGTESTEPEYLTLNYDVRILGRKGVLSMNAVGSMYQLDTINKHIPDVLNIATFNDGFAYKDFNPSMDKVAAYTVGGLIAGKLIAKTGLFILLLKNIKLILLACFGFFGAFRKKIANFFTKKRKDDEGFAMYDEEVVENNATIELALETNSNESIADISDQQNDENNFSEPSENQENKV